MDAEFQFYDQLYYRENDLLMKHVYQSRYKGYICNICNRDTGKMHAIKCNYCLEYLTVPSSDYYLYPQICSHCVKKYDLCTNRHPSQFRKEIVKKLNLFQSHKTICSANSCKTIIKTNNQCIDIDRCAKINQFKNNGQEIWKWKHGFYAYKLHQSWVESNADSKQKIRKISGDFFRLFCQKCTKTIHPNICSFKGCYNKEYSDCQWCINHRKCIRCHRYRERFEITLSKCDKCGSLFCNDNDKCGFMNSINAIYAHSVCILCHKKIIGNQLLSSIKNAMEGNNTFDEFISAHRSRLLSCVKRWLEPIFGDAIANIISDFCVGENIGEKLLIEKKCAVYCCTLFIIPTASKLFHTGSYYYKLDDEYVHNMRQFSKNNRNSFHGNRNPFMNGVRRIGDAYYRIFCASNQVYRSYGIPHMRFRLQKCEFDGCNNKDISTYCRNHWRCSLCKTYLCITDKRWISLWNEYYTNNKKQYLMHQILYQEYESDKCWYICPLGPKLRPPKLYCLIGQSAQHVKYCEPICCSYWSDDSYVPSYDPYYDDPYKFHGAVPYKSDHYQRKYGRGKKKKQIMDTTSSLHASYVGVASIIAAVYCISLSIIQYFKKHTEDIRTVRFSVLSLLLDGFASSLIALTYYSPRLGSNQCFCGILWTTACCSYILSLYAIKGLFVVKIDAVSGNAAFGCTHIVIISVASGLSVMAFLCCIMVYNLTDGKCHISQNDYGCLPMFDSMEIYIAFVMLAVDALLFALFCYKWYGVMTIFKWSHQNDPEKIKNFVQVFVVQFILTILCMVSCVFDGVAHILLNDNGNNYHITMNIFLLDCVFIATCNFLMFESQINIGKTVCLWLCPKVLEISKFDTKKSR